MPKFLKPENFAGFYDFAYGFKDDIKLYDNKTEFDAGKEDWLAPIFICSFIKRCLELVNRGLYKSYETQTDDLTFLRGKLIMKQQMKNDFKKKLAFNCEFDELITNNLENQICLNVLENLCYPRLKDSEQRRRCNTLIKRFSMEVDKTLGEGRTTLQEKDFQNIVYNRMNERYKDAHTLGKMIWQHAGISDLYKFKKSNINSFFVPMNDVFEKFLGQLFERYYPEFKVEEQKYKPAWKKQVEDEDKETSQGIRTDILLRDKENDELKHIIDAKYMEKIDTKDRYEIGFYIHEYAQTEGFAILPHDKRAEYDKVLTPEKKKKLVDMRLRDYSITSEKHGIKINIKHLDIDNLLDAIYRKGLSSHIVRYLIQGLITS
jgi:5-methylcytosine-specific restriction enzyme subunit McrC